LSGYSATGAQNITTHRQLNSKKRWYGFDNRHSGSKKTKAKLTTISNSTSGSLTLHSTIRNCSRYYKSVDEEFLLSEHGEEGEEMLKELRAGILLSEAKL